MRSTGAEHPRVGDQDVAALTQAHWCDLFGGGKRDDLGQVRQVIQLPQRFRISADAQSGQRCQRYVVAHAHKQSSSHEAVVAD
jgi:hypothetical protein